ncbi:MAG: hypothetical protein IJV36_02275 [Prevotella sp.]|nr:hypothetical protein [Prevotella sp.]
MKKIEMREKGEPKLTYALNADNELVSIETISVRGRKCNCYCPKCNEQLVAKLGNGGRQPHFAHSKDSDCHGSYMTALHLMAEQIIKEKKAVVVPAYKEVIPSQKLLFKDVEVEQRVDRKDLQPDLVGITEDGRRWTIEILNTHEVDEAKRIKLIESNITCLEINVAEKTLEELESFLLDSDEDREWLNNPNYDLQIADAKRKIVSLVESFIIGKQEILIPPYKGSESRTIRLQESLLLERTDDGMFSRIKVVSSDGKPYVFNIGNEYRLTYLIALNECDELNINIDKFPIGTDSISNVDIEWLYNFDAEKRQKEKVTNKENDSTLEERPSSDCIFECKYKPFRGDCIYKVKTIEKNGMKYVVCNVKKQKKDEQYILPMPRKEEFSSISIHVKSDHDKEKRKLEQEEKVKQDYPPNEDTTSSGELPWEMYWTIDAFYERLQSIGSYRTEFGEKGEIVKCDKIANIVLVFYKVYISNGLCNQFVYYIDKVTIVNGKPHKTNVDFYYVEFRALTEYQKVMDRINLEQVNENNNGDLPF